MSIVAERKKQELVERFGLDPVPKELRTSSWFDFLYIGIAFSVNTGNFLVPALAVLEGGLSFPFAVLSTVLGATLAFFFVSYLSLPGAAHGIPSQYAIRAMIGIKGARYVASPVRTLTSLYWFAVQTIGGTYVIKELTQRLWNLDIPFYFISIILASIMALLALIGFDAIKKATKYFIPFLFLGQGAILYLYITTSQTEKTFFDVFNGEQSFSMTSFLFFMGLAFVQYVSGVSSSSDIARYAKSEKHSFYGLFAGNVIGFSMAAVLAAFSAQELNSVNPFVSATELTDSYLLIGLITICALVSMVSINMSNAYTGGFSLLNSLPKLGRVKSAFLFGVIGVLFSCFPSLVTEAKQFISLLGAFVVPLSAVIITDFIVFKKSKIDILDLERILDKSTQINQPAFLTIAIGIIVYFFISDNFSPGLCTFLISSVLYVICKKVHLSLTRVKKKSSLSA
ncbi:purine-cytosine permease family protein [Bacillus sp. DJP31]|uniref:purine-cytosine permease family protein n=1 Tax=Bacillus sp. DJP31 TaxID=3409789 RepID=UPI003BB7E387